MNEASLVEAYGKLICQLEGNNQRLHLSKAQKNLCYKEPKDEDKERWLAIRKPWGLWYGFGNSWMRGHILNILVNCEYAFMKFCSGMNRKF
jgi:hypothetical protein